tara:strand:+ start:5855 stop:6196 length:342 start_codon:yes stop_codon:yes gene_type:complete
MTNPPPVVEICDLAAALAALDAAPASQTPLILTTPPGAASWLGVPLFAEIARQARRQSRRNALFILDCADNAGAAAEALGTDDIDGVIFSGKASAYERLSRLAAATGKTITAS